METVGGKITVISTRPAEDFVETNAIRELTGRGIRYMKAGFPIHLSGPTGCGKTTLAIHIAHQIGRPVILLNGDEEFSTSSLVGSEFGYRRSRVVDRFVSRVYKENESVSKTWLDDRLTTACKLGFTLIYNEFTRSRPEANNILLSVLEEKILEMPSAAHGSSYIRVHPEFRAIFTSNPEEYAGVFRSQDALMDRMVTIHTGYYDEETEIAIVAKKASIPVADAAMIVHLIRDLRSSDLCASPPTVRSAIAIGRASQLGGEEWYRQVCSDILLPKIGDGQSGDLDGRALLDRMILVHGTPASSRSYDYLEEVWNHKPKGDKPDTGSSIAEGVI